MKDKDIFLHLLKKNYDLLTEENDFLKREIETFHLEVSNYEKRIKRLNIENKELSIGNNRYKTIIKENFTVDMLLYLENCKSIKKTAEYFSYDPDELFYDISTWENSFDILSKSNDYNEFSYKKDNKSRCESIESIESIDDK
jgi:hypothetical protein